MIHQVSQFCAWLGICFYIAAQHLFLNKSWEVAATYEKCWPSHGQAIEGRARRWKWGAEHLINEEHAPLKELGAGELEAEERNQPGFLLGQPGNMLGSYPWGNIRGWRQSSRRSQWENSGAQVYVLQKPNLEACRHPACSWHALKEHRQELLEFHIFCFDLCTTSICEPNLFWLVIVDLG